VVAIVHHLLDPRGKKIKRERGGGREKGKRKQEEGKKVSIKWETGWAGEPV
jgi:hypothetical protein